MAERAYKTLQRIGAEGQVTAPARASVEVRNHPYTCVTQRGIWLNCTMQICWKVQFVLIALG